VAARSDHPELRPSAATSDEWQDERRRRRLINTVRTGVFLAIGVWTGLTSNELGFVLAAVVVSLGLSVVVRLASQRRDRARKQARGALFAGRTTLHALKQLGNLPATAEAVGSVRFPWWQAQARPLDMVTGELYLLVGDAREDSGRRTGAGRPRTQNYYVFRWEPGAHARSVGANEFSVDGKRISRIEVETERRRWGKVRFHVLPVGHIDLSVQQSQRLVRALGDATPRCF
jgi:hypothetical protein